MLTGYGFSRTTRQIHYMEHEVGQLGAMMYEVIRLLLKRCR